MIKELIKEVEDTLSCSVNEWCDSIGDDLENDLQDIRKEYEEKLDKELRISYLRGILHGIESAYGVCNDDLGILRELAVEYDTELHKLLNEHVNSK